MKKAPSRPSRKETREHQHHIAEFDDYRQAKYDRDAPLPPAGMMSNTQILRREAAKNLKALPDMVEEVYAETIQQIQEECETALERDEYLVLRRFLALRGPRLLIEVPPVGWRVQEWWFAAKQGNQDAKKNLEAVLDALHVGSGRYTKFTEEERKVIVADFKKWLPVCRKLKKNLSSLRQDPDWTSEQFRNKAIDMLAEKHFFSRSEVAEIEDLPPTLTPWRMTMRLVARRHKDANGLMMGEKTVEEIYRDWLKERPESRMKKTKISTTPVAERTA